MRSSIETLMDETAEIIALWAENIGASISYSGRYPAWQYAENSKLREDYIKCYSEFCEDTPKVIIIHAGLECGIITKALPIDAICCGALVEYLHSPNERMNKASLAKFYKIMKRFIDKGYANGNASPAGIFYRQKRWRWQFWRWWWRRSWR